MASVRLEGIAGELAPVRGHIDVRGDVIVCPQELSDEPLSPGERRRAQIGAALAQRPDVLVLDEPTYPGALVLVTHDDAFAGRCTSASRICTRTS